MRTVINVVLGLGVCVMAEPSDGSCVGRQGAVGCDSAGDEASLLTKQIHRYGHQSSVRHASAKKNATSESQRFMYNLTDVFGKTAQKWNSSLVAYFDCVQAKCDNLDDKRQALEDVAVDAGYECTLDDIIAYAQGYHTSSITTFSALFYTKVLDTQDSIEVQVYATQYDPIEVVVNGSSINNWTWVPNCGTYKCVSDPNVLSWNKADGNPSSGKLNFVYITPFETLPDNSYLGPFLYGSITGLEHMPNDGPASVFGVLNQNAVINRDPVVSTKKLMTSPMQSMMNGAPESDFLGVYCLMNILDDGSSSYMLNLTMNDDSVLLDLKDIQDYQFDNSRLVFSSDKNEYSGSLLFGTKATSDYNLVIGDLTHKNGSVYNVSGTTAPPGASCLAAPPSNDREGWWSSWSKKHEALVITSSVVVGIISVGGGGYLMYLKYAQTMMTRQIAAMSFYGDSMEPSPTVLTNDEEAMEYLRRLFEATANEDSADESFEDAYDRIDSIEEALNNPYLDPEIREELEAQLRTEQTLLQQAKIEQMYWTDQADNALEISEEFQQEANDLAEADQSAEDAWEQQMEDEFGGMDWEQDNLDVEGYSDSGMFDVML